MNSSALNLSALIDFNKYTLAIAAAAVVYTLQTFIPAERVEVRWLVLALLLVFLTSLGCGALLFAACTRALHQDAAASGPTPAPGSPAQAKTDLPAVIRWLGTAHAVLLVVGLAFLCALFVPRVLSAPTSPAPLVIRCAESDPPTAAPPVIGPGQR